MAERMLGARVRIALPAVPDPGAAAVILGAMLCARPPSRGSVRNEPEDPVKEGPRKHQNRQLMKV